MLLFMRYLVTSLNIFFCLIAVHWSLYCLKSVCIRSFSGPHSVRMRKNTDQEKIPNTDTFYTVLIKQELRVMSVSHRLQKNCELWVKSLELNAQVDKNLRILVTSYKCLFVCFFSLKQSRKITPENTKSLRTAFSKNTSLGSCYSCFSFLSNLTEKYDVEVWSSRSFFS